MGGAGLAARPLLARPFLGWRRPRRNLSGTGFSGEVVAVGPQVRRFAPADAVFGETGLRFGANASHVCLAEDGVVMKKPAALSHAQAAVMCDGPLTSWHFLHELAAVRAGERVLVLGGSGSLGSAAVQIARAAGAHVSATCSGRNAALVRGFGAHETIDHGRQNVADLPVRFDVIHDTVGAGSFGQLRDRLNDGGRCLCPVLGLRLVVAMRFNRRSESPRAMFAATGLQPPERLRQHLARLLEMAEAGTLAPFIERVYPLADLIAAHRHMETGRKRGNLVVV